jgi:hypothetical protein
MKHVCCAVQAVHVSGSYKEKMASAVSSVVIHQQPSCVVHQFRIFAMGSLHSILHVQLQHSACSTAVTSYVDLDMQSNEPRGAEGILETRQAYDFTLDTIGQDIHSGEEVNGSCSPFLGVLCIHPVWCVPSKMASGPRVSSHRQSHCH